MSGGSSLARRRAVAAGSLARPVSERSAALTDPTEVRLLDRLQVRRRDGSVIGESEWRTRKNIDLFRILALSVGEPVSVDRLIDMLWPNTERERSGASLRTAASQIRGILGYDAIKRRRAGLELDGVWVDTQAFLARARVSHQAHLEGRQADAVAAARQAEALYLRDLEMGEMHSGEMAQWFEAERQRLVKAYTKLMIEAGVDALSLGWLRDAANFAEQATDRDPYCEEAYRTGMLALAGIGEVEHALALYTRCKDLLAADLGVDPTAQTQAVYLQILRSGSNPSVVSAPLVGRDDERAQVLRRVSAMSRSNGGCLVVLSPARGGSSRLLAAVATDLGSPVQRSSAPAAIHGATAAGEYLVHEGVEAWPVGHLRQLLALLQASAQGTTVLAAHRQGVDARSDAELHALKAEGHVETLTLEPLGRSEVKELAQHLLSGPPTPNLVDVLVEDTGGRPGAVVDTIQDWLSRGRVVHTGQGLDVPTEDPGVDHQVVYRQLRGVHEQLTGAQQTVLGVVAVLGRGVSTEAVATVLARSDGTATDATVLVSTLSEVEHALSYLQDLAVLTVDSRGRFTFKSPILRDVVCDWLRPAALRALHRSVAERLHLSPGARVIHWLGAGEPGLACAAALAAANTAMASHDFTAGRLQLLEARDLIDRETADPHDLINLLSQLAFCSDRLGLDSEAVENRAAAARLSETYSLALPTEPLRSIAPVNPIAPRGRHTRPLSERIGISIATPPSSEAEAVLRTAYSSAIRRGEEFEAAEARSLIAGLILLPRRQFVEARHLLALTNLHPVSAQNALSYLTSQEANVLLGDPAVDIDVLDRVKQVTPGLRGLVSGVHVEMLCALARHDLGRPDARPMLDSAIEHAKVTKPEGPWRFVAARMLVDRREWERAAELAEGEQLGQGGPIAHMLVQLGKSAIARAQDLPDLAERHLQLGVERAQLAGATLMLPELASRRVALGRDIELSSAIDHLDLAERSQGEVAVGRERVTLALARAAVRATTGRLLQAAEVAGAAAELATALGLKYCAAEAQELRQAYLDDAYRRADMSPDDVGAPTTAVPRLEVRRLSAS